MPSSFALALCFLQGQCRLPGCASLWGETLPCPAPTSNRDSASAALRDGGFVGLSPQRGNQLIQTEGAEGGAVTQPDDGAAGTIIGDADDGKAVVAVRPLRALQAVFPGTNQPWVGLTQPLLGTNKRRFWTEIARNRQKTSVFSEKRWFWTFFEGSAGAATDSKTDAARQGVRG